MECELLGRFAPYRQRDRFADEDFIRKDRQHGLFAIAELFGRSHGFEGDRACILRYSDAPSIGFGLVGREFEALFGFAVFEFGVHVRLIDRIGQMQRDGSLLDSVRLVGDFGGKLDEVPLA